MSETAIVQAVRLALSRVGVRIFRNNVGVLPGADGRMVRFGLHPGSSDLIGWQSVLVTPDMVGQRVALFVAVEVKTSTGRLSAPQRHFLETAKMAGGIAILARDPDEAVAGLARTPQSAP